MQQLEHAQAQGDALHAIERHLKRRVKGLLRRAVLAGLMGLLCLGAPRAKDALARPPSEARILCRRQPPCRFEVRARLRIDAATQIELRCFDQEQCVVGFARQLRPQPIPDRRPVVKALHGVVGRLIPACNEQGVVQGKYVAGRGAFGPRVPPQERAAPRQGKALQALLGGQQDHIANQCTLADRCRRIWIGATEPDLGAAGQVEGLDPRARAHHNVPLTVVRHAQQVGQGAHSCVEGVGMAPSQATGVPVVDVQVGCIGRRDDQEITVHHGCAMPPYAGRASGCRTNR